MNAPRLGYGELVDGQDVPETTVNEMTRYLEQGAGIFIFTDRDLATPPGSPAQGVAYLVAASPTGAWTGHAGAIAFYLGSAWAFITPTEGHLAWVKDEDVFVLYDGAAWLVSAGPVKAPTTQAGTTYTAVLADAGGYIQFTNVAAVTFTIPPNASVAYPIGTVITVEQNNIGGVTFTPGSGVTLRSRGGYLQTAGQYAVAQAKKVATNTWTIIGDVA